MPLYAVRLPGGKQCRVSEYLIYEGCSPSQSAPAGIDVVSVSVGALRERERSARADQRAYGPIQTETKCPSDKPA